MPERTGVPIFGAPFFVASTFSLNQTHQTKAISERHPHMRLIAILEDDTRRIADMQSAATVLSECEFCFFSDAHEMTTWLASNLERVSLLSLDCDLDATWLAGVECGSGENVTAFLAQYARKLPIIIHSSNALRAPAMHMELVLAGCSSVMLCPFVDGQRWGMDVSKALNSRRS